MMYFSHYGFMAFALPLPAAIHNRYYLDVVPIVATPHLLHTIILETGLVCSKAEQIESASQLKRHTYLIQPVIQSYALFPLHNTLSHVCNPSPQGSCIVISLIVTQGQLHL